MSPRRTAARAVVPVAVALLLGVLTACGNDREDVEKAFRAYHTALLARDFRTACSYNTQEATDKLLVSLRTQGIDAASCEDAFAAIYAEAGSSAAADGVGRTVQVQDVAVDGDTATVSWTAQLDGEPRASRSTMRHVDGEWRFVTD